MAPAAAQMSSMICGHNVGSIVAEIVADRTNRSGFNAKFRMASTRLRIAPGQL